MSESKKIHSASVIKLNERIQSLEFRIERLEEQLTSLRTSDKSSEQISVYRQAEQKKEYNSLYESGIVEHGFAWISSIVYMFGIVFLMTYTRSTELYWLAPVTGYGGVLSMFILSNLLKKSFPHLISAIQISALLLLYYTTLKLHFFTDTPVIEKMAPGLIILLLVNSIHLYYGISGKKEFFTGIAMILLAATALFSDTTMITLPLLAFIPVCTLILFSRLGWWRILLFSLFLVYLSHALWYFNNPIMGHPFRAVDSHQNNIIFLFIYAAIYFSTIIVPHKKSISNTTMISIAVWNALLFTLLVLLVALGFYEQNYTWIFILIAILCIAFSIYLKKRSDRNFAPAFYACFGFMGLSVAVYGFEGVPLVYFFLALQSLLVVSMALWFRSQIIVVVNTILFLIILMVYIFGPSNINYISFTFAIVAFATARILNWKKERLTLKTEILRNLYLISGSLVMLYGVHHAAPSEYITFSWTAMAMIYFILSIVLSNIKYRWMAILTILISSIRLFLVDLANLDLGYRVIAFLFFALIALSVSIYYTKKIKNKV